MPRGRSLRGLNPITVPPRRLAALALRAALTYFCAVLVHGAVHAAGSRSFALESPAHVVMLLTALAGLLGAAYALGVFAPAAERRRRLALNRASLPLHGPAAIAATVAGQGFLAAALFLPEGTGLDPQRLLLAVVCGLLALVLTTVLFAARSRGVVNLLAAFFALRERRVAPLTFHVRTACRVRTSAPSRLFVPNRPPPIAA